MLRSIRKQDALGAGDSGSVIRLPLGVHRKSWKHKIAEKNWKHNLAVTANLCFQSQNELPDYLQGAERGTVHRLLLYILLSSPNAHEVLS